MGIREKDEWSLNSRYVALGGLPSLTDTGPTRLPAVAR